MNINTGFDASNNSLNIVITSNLLVGYYPNFKGMILESKGMPKGMKVEKQDSNSAVISFPITGSGMVKSSSTEGMMRVAIDKNTLDSIYKAIDSFVNACLRHKLRTTEFLPIGGKDYSVENLQSDVKRAISMKSNFCLINTYKEFLDNEKTQKYIYNQYFIKYGTDEYSDVAIDIMGGDLKSVQKKYKSKLKLTNWY